MAGVQVADDVDKLILFFFFNPPADGHIMLLHRSVCAFYNF